MREKRLGELARAAAPGDDEPASRLALAHAERLDALVEACVGLIEHAPRHLSRDAGEAGRAWDRFLEAVEPLDPDVRTGSSRLTGRPVTPDDEETGPVQGSRLAGLSGASVASVAMAAARLQSRVDAVADPELSVAWDLFLVALSGGE